MKKSLTLCMVTALMVFGAGIARADLVTNGSFESGSYSANGSGFMTLSAGSTAINGWTVTGGGVDWIGTYWTADAGSMSLDLSGNNPGGIQLGTSLATTAGQEYVLQFYLAGNPDGPPTIKPLQVTVGNLTPMMFYFNDTGFTKANMGWALETFYFTASSSTTTLLFTSNSGTAYGPALDNVSVNAVPEPSLTLLFGMGLGAVSLVGLRRKS